MPLEIEDRMNLTLVIKSYLRQKTITSQNVSSEAQVKNCFLYRREVMFRSHDIQVFVTFNHLLMIYQICDVMMSISTCGKVHFRIYLLNHNSLSHHTWPIDRYKQGQ